MILTFLSDVDGGQGKVFFVVLRTLERWLSQKPNDDGLVFQASADCLSHSPIMITSPRRAGYRGICASISEASQSIHAQIIIPLVFQEHTVTGASMPKSQSARVPRAYVYRSIHAQIIIPFVFQEHTVARASMPKS